jgi:hypothetical protein
LKPVFLSRKGLTTRLKAVSLKVTDYSEEHSASL